MPSYDAFGLSWRLPFACPEMGSSLPNTTADVTVCYGSVPGSLSGAIEVGPFLQITVEAVLFCFPSVGRYLIQNGHTILIEPDKAATEDQIRLFLLGTVASLLLHQRGLLPLHASGIRTPLGAVLFTGDSGFGKSTLLAAFLVRGYQMLTDDLAAIKVDASRHSLVFPGYPQIKLWADSADKLHQPTEETHRLHPDLDKFAIPTNSPLEKEPLPLHAIYTLTPNKEPTLYLEPLTNAQKFSAFFEHTRQNLALRGMSRHVDHFRQVVTVANQTRVLRVYRPEKPFLPHALADLIEQDFLR